MRALAVTSTEQRWSVEVMAIHGASKPFIRRS
jgi:hypothetical protein